MYKFKDQREFAYSWLHNGQVPTGEPGESMSVRDAIATPNAALWLPKVIEMVVREAIEPLLVGTSLFTRVDYKAGQFITFPATGALEAADIAEGGSYPEKQLSWGGAITTANVGKSGIAVKITEEMVNDSQFDLINMHLRKAGQALARHKEKKAFNFIKAMGTVCFDNLNPGSSAFGVTHGRALDGSANGSAIADDLFDTYSQLVYQGFTPDTILVHPLTWVMFVKDPVLRQIMLAGGNQVWFAGWNGNPAGRASWGNGPQGKYGVGQGQDIIPGGNPGGQTATALAGYSQTITSAPNMPSYFPFPFRVIVSPFVNYNPSTKLTDIMMFDSAELGSIVVAEDPTTEEWKDPSVDMYKIKIRERYGFFIHNEGQGIGVMKNVKVISNEIALPAQASISVSGSIASISNSTALSL